MPTLHLGTIEVPYTPPAARPGRRRRGTPRVMTTGDVAEILEARYHIMQHFWEIHGDDSAGDLEESLSGAIETFIMGGPVNLDPFGSATSKIEDRFKQMLSTRELDSLGYPGIPTAAAERGVSHRFKRPYQRRKSRSSFVDTGLYQASFKAWLE